MLRALKRLLMHYRTEDHEPLKTPQDEHAEFELLYNDLVVGKLKLYEGKWTFAYSEEFKEQHDVQPLIAFADTTKLYEADSLWPFFVARIPSTAQPQVRQAIDKEGLDEHSDLELLKRFGTRTIANPFVLIEADSLSSSP